MVVAPRKVGSLDAVLEGTTDELKVVVDLSVAVDSFVVSCCDISEGGEVKEGG